MIENNKTLSTDDLNGIIADTKNQIQSFDQKASILLAVDGIVFGLLVNFLDLFSDERFINNQNECLKTFYKIFFILFVIFAFIAIVSFIFVILPNRKPRTKSKNVNNKLHINYYWDCANLNIDTFNEASKEYIKTDEILVQQAINNAKVAKKKHIILVIGIILTVFFAILSLALLGIYVLF